MTTRAGTGVAALDAMATERGIELQHEVPLGPFTSLRLGGPAERFAAPTTREALVGLLELARDAGLRPFMLGNGSDLVVADAGMAGLVIRTRARAVAVDGETLRVDAGAPMAMLVKRCTAEGLAGLEFGISIPGTLGGAVWANAGAHGGDMAQVVVTVDAWEARRGVIALPAAECGFSYRESRFKHDDEVILGATLQLTRGEPAAIAGRVAEHQAQRLATQPLAEQNAGSVFRNPPGDHAGRLIESAGLKGERVGSAQVSTLHANFIIADRGGRAGDVRALGDRVRRIVAERTGVTLEYEIEFVGRWEEDR